MNRFVNYTLFLILVISFELNTSGQAFSQQPQLPPGVRVVDASAPNPGGVENGLSWPTAFRHLQSALLVANDPQNEITQVWIAQGTYYPDEFGPGGGTDSRLHTFAISREYDLLGGFPSGGGDGTIDAQQPDRFITILSGDITQDDNPTPQDPFNGNANNSYHVLAVLYSPIGQPASQAIIDGFTITRGNANDTSMVTGAQGGGAILHGEVFIPAPAFRRCIITGNDALDRGGGIFARRISVSMRDCVIEGNVCRGVGSFGTDLIGGGGLHVEFGRLKLVNTRFESNQSLTGTIPGRGGALVYAGVEGPPDPIINCQFIGNMAEDDYGAAFLNSNALLVNCLFRDNHAGGNVGALRAVVADIINCTIAGNSASDSLGGIAHLHPCGVQTPQFDHLLQHRRQSGHNHPGRTDRGLPA
jgi:hypothetical protein